MTPDQLKALIIKQRSSWLDLEDEKDGKPAKRVQVQRPAELQLREMMKFDAQGKLTSVDIDLPQVQQYVTDWQGFTESDLVGGAGGSDQAAFHPDLWAAVIIDKAAWHRKVAEKLMEMITDHLTKEAEQAKN